MCASFLEDNKSNKKLLYKSDFLFVVCLSFLILDFSVENPESVTGDVFNPNLHIYFFLFILVWQLVWTSEKTNCLIMQTPEIIPQYVCHLDLFLFGGINPFTAMKSLENDP